MVVERHDREEDSPRITDFVFTPSRFPAVQQMPTVLRHGPYRFFFYAGDGHEPLHVHVERDSHAAKFWLDPVRLQDSGGLRRSDLRDVERLVTEHQATLMEAWNEYFNR